MRKKIFVIAAIISTLGVNASPLELYENSLQVLQDNFYDKTMNHQNWNYWKSKYQNISSFEDACLAIETAVESLNDPYTRFMQPNLYKEETLCMEGKEKKIGIYLKIGKNKLSISPVKGGAAEKAGIRKNDIVLEINDKPVKDMSSVELNSALSVENADRIKFLIKRKHCPNTIYTIELKEENNNSIYNTPFYKNIKIPDNIMYLRIASFMDKNIAAQFQKILDKNQDKDGYIIDLRGNTGGVAKNAAVMANMLLRNDIILSIVDRDGNKKVINANNDTMTDKPVVVLCDRYSASASEIFVAAMKDNKRAVIIGEKTFGKGIMQDVFGLSDGCGMNITVKHYLTPSGEFIHKKGIEPDINIKMSKIDYKLKKDKALKEAIKIISSND